MKLSAETLIEVKRIARWLAVSSILAAVIYAGFVLEIKGAQNIVQFYAWFVFIVSCCMMAPTSIKLIADKPEIIPPKAFRVVDVTIDIGVTLVLIWFGWTWTGAAYLLHIIITQSALNLAEQHIIDLLRQKESE